MTALLATVTIHDVCIIRAMHGILWFTETNPGQLMPWLPKMNFNNENKTIGPTKVNISIEFIRL